MNNQTQQKVIKKLEILTRFQKATMILDKEDDKLTELENRKNEKQQIDEIKQKLNI